MMGHELTAAEVKLVKKARESEEFEVNLTYSAIGTMGFCPVKAKVIHSQMELVKAGGGGFEVRDMWDVTATEGLCAF
jgi:hypothetical protein